jgi:hypothetical protein
MAAVLPSIVLPQSMAIREVAKLLETESKKIRNANAVLCWRWLLYQTELQNCSHMHSTFCLSKMHMLVGVSLTYFPLADITPASFMTASLYQTPFIFLAVFGSNLPTISFAENLL